MDLNINLASRKELDEKWEALLSEFKKDKNETLPVKEANEYLSALGVRMGYAIGGFGHSNSPFIYATLVEYLDALEKDYPGVKEAAGSLRGLGTVVSVKIPANGGDRG